MEAWLSVRSEDPIQGLHDLDQWLNYEPELRGKVAPRISPLVAGELGVSSDVLIAALSGGGAVTVLVGSLKAFLARPRGSDVRIVVSAPNGRTVELEAQRVDDVEILVRQTLSLSAEQHQALPSQDAS